MEEYNGSKKYRIGDIYMGDNKDNSSTPQKPKRQDLIGKRLRHYRSGQGNLAYSTVLLFKLDNGDKKV